MRYLIRMVTPPGGVVLDPFTGSGATGAAAILEGFSFIGYEQDPKFADIARRRIAHFEREGARPADAPPPKKPKPAPVGTARLDAFGTVAE